MIRTLIQRFRRSNTERTPRQSVVKITRLFRNPTQLALIARLLPDPLRQPCRIAVHGVADGCEAVSLLASLVPDTADPAGVDLRIDGFDNNPTWLAMAHRFTFAQQQLPPEVPASLRRLLRRGVLRRDLYLRTPWRGFFSFSESDVLVPAASLRRYDLVTCQNVLVGLPAEHVATAIDNLTAQVAPGGLLAVGGGPLDTVPSLVIDHGFEPILDDVEAVHESWKTQRQFYDHEKRPFWALEPFDAHHPDGPARFCTLFRAPGGASS